VHTGILSIERGIPKKRKVVVVDESPVMMGTPDVVDQGRVYYLVNSQCNFLQKVKKFFDWKAATRDAPTTVKAY
jgi:hypothetical protein